ncbi:PIN domain-containing protein [Candidatus Microgenomates bacterium]|nr:PIN domain-containing protein [Candidatus Microgenomates bacterium]
MKKYLVDTNVFLRFLLKDHLKHFKIANKYFLQAKKGKIVLILIPEVVLEIEYVLRGVYSLSKKEITGILESLVKSPALKVVNREILIKCLDRYKKLKVDLTDLFLYETAQKEKARVLSFDKDFTKIEKKSINTLYLRAKPLNNSRR